MGSIVVYIYYVAKSYGFSFGQEKIKPVHNNGNRCVSP